mmetsp:Transcript_45330/g.107862  ORF Transcript_45330/g.107862 Transcript_45330/m.107862 type:complete len:1589 (-) Transcript_45330:100-4866(-)
MDPGVDSDFLQVPPPRPSNNSFLRYTPDGEGGIHYGDAAYNHGGGGGSAADAGVLEVPAPRMPSRDSDDARRLSAPPPGSKAWMFEPEDDVGAHEVQGSLISRDSYDSMSSPGVPVPVTIESPTAPYGGYGLFPPAATAYPPASYSRDRDSRPQHATSTPATQHYDSVPAPAQAADSRPSAASGGAYQQNAPPPNPVYTNGGGASGYGGWRQSGESQQSAHTDPESPPITADARTSVDDEKTSSDLGDRDAVSKLSKATMAEALYGNAFKPATRCPCCCATISIAACIAIVVVGLILRFPEVNTNFDDFMKTDVDSSRMHDALLAALDYRDPAGPSDERRRLRESLNISIRPGEMISWEDDLVPEYLPANDSRRLQGLPLFKQFDLFVVYELNPGSGYQNLFDEFVLLEIANLENRLLGLPSWSKFCHETEGFNFVGLCNPGLSFVNYALPTMEIRSGGVIPNMFTFNGDGRDLLPAEIMFRMTELHDLNGIMLPESHSEADPSTLATSTGNIREIRTAFRFKVLCCTSADSSAYQSSQVSKFKEDWEVFLKEEVLPILQEPVPSSWTDSNDEEKYPVNVWYTGDAIEGIEVMQTLVGDLYLAIGSMSFVLAYMVFHTRSCFLSFCGLITIFLSVPVSYVVFAMLAETSQMSIASFLSVFLVVGLGADVVFVYTDFWRDSEHITKKEALRMEWTYRHAAKASFATTSTTAISFLANLASVLRSLREFGTFMGFCVMFVWIIVSLIYVPMCAIDDRWFRRCRVRCCCCPRRAPESDKDTLKSKIFEQLVRFMQPLRRIIVGISVLAGFLMLVIALSMAETDTSGFPNIFPKDHNQNKGQEVIDRFRPISEVFPSNTFGAPPLTETVCDEHAVVATSPSMSAACSLFWCEVQPTIAVPDATCRCWRKEAYDVNSTSVSAIAVQRVIGLNALTKAQAVEVFAPTLIDGQTPGVSAPGGLSSVVRTPVPAADILMQEWFEGTVELDPMWDVLSVLNRDSAASPVQVEDICYCNTSACRVSNSDWKEVNPIPYPATGLFRRMMYLNNADLQIRADLRPLINIVFGIQVTDGTPLLGERENLEKWSFLDTFEAAQPWAQRNMLSFCEDFTEELRVVGRPWARCWIEEFKDWVLSSSSPLAEAERRFPVPLNRYNELITQFKGRLSPYSGSTYQDSMWLRDDGEGNDMVKAAIFKFNVDISENIAVDPGLDFMDLWDLYVGDFNNRAVRYARGVFHTSDLWVRLEAQRQLITSTVVTIGIVLGLAFLGMLVFTCNIILSALVVICTLQVIFGLAFFISVIMQWPIGPVEVIALIVFIGYAVTYSLHIAHKFGSHEAIDAYELREDLHKFSAVRHNRVRFALTMIGTAAIGSAVTTFGCAAFLLGCQLTIFNKLGGVVMAVTVMSIITALVTLPAVLLVIGPTHKGCIGVHCNREDVRDAKQRLSATFDSSLRTSSLRLSSRSGGSDRQTLREEERDPTSSTVAHHGSMRTPGSEKDERLTPVTAVTPSTGERGAPSPDSPARVRGHGLSPDRYLADDPGRAVPSDRMSGFDIGMEAPLQPIQAQQVQKAPSRTPSRSPRGARSPTNLPRGRKPQL